MASRIFKLELASKTTAQLIKGVKVGGSRVFTRRVFAQASSISKEIGAMLVTNFNATPVARSLRGQGLEDLPAHFGLDDGLANDLVDGMSEIIRTSVRILSRGEGDVVSVRIQGIESDWEKYVTLPGAQYISKPSNATIPVVRWLLINPNIDIGQAAFDIVFSGENDKIDARIQKVSRSGRAIMVSLSTLGGGGGYVLPDIISGKFGKNFIEFALGQPGIAQQAANILMKRVR